MASAASVVKRTRRPAWQAQTASAVARCVLPVPRVADQDHAVAVIDPGALGERGDRGLRDLRVLGEAEVLQALDRREPRVDQAPAFATFGAFGHLGLQQRAEVGDRGLLLAGGFLGERAEAAADGRQLQIDRVRLDQRFQGRGLGVRRGHHVPPSSWS